MSIGHIYIKGPIGNTYKEDGTVEEKGVELVDVMEQVSNLPESTQQIHCHINSPGGYVEIGNEIHDYLKTLDNLTTIADGQCASIATKIFLAAPLQNRKAKAGVQFMIHNPFLQGVSGDGATLKSLGEETEQIEKSLESDYAKATGLTKEAISGLMKMTTYFTPEQLVSFKFASEVIPQEPLKAVARLYNTTQKNMKSNLNFYQRSKVAMAIMRGEDAATATRNATREAKALMIETEDVSFMTEFSDIAVGDPVMDAEGNPVTDGSLDGVYTLSVGGVMTVEGVTLAEGSTIEVSENAVSNITPAEGSSDEEEEEEELPTENKTVDELKAELDAVNQKNQELEGQLKEITEEVEAQAQMKSTWQPPRATATFRATA